jgi:hypothetical protein
MAGRDRLLLSRPSFGTLFAGAEVRTRRGDRGGVPQEMYNWTSGYARLWALRTCGVGPNPAEPGYMQR